MNEDQWLKYAKNLHFSEAEYEEAVRLIGAPVPNANQLVVALLDVSNRRRLSNGSDAAGCGQKSAHYLGDPLPPVTEGADDHRSLVSSSSNSTISSSCYSSIASVPSSLPEGLKKIFIDGPNVARTHGKDAAFSMPGIKICVDWFLAREHRVKVFVPSDRCHLAEPSLIDYLRQHDSLIKTPTGCNDDLFVIEAAMQNNAIIVSNDLFRDESRFNVEVKNFIRSNRLPYIFVDDLFIPAKDPLGKTGPNLDDFLRHQSCYQPQQQHDSVHTKLTRAKSYQRNMITTPMRQHQSLHRSLQASRSLPIQPPPIGGHSNSFNPNNDGAVVVDRSYQFTTGDSRQTNRLRQSLKKSISVAATAEGRQVIEPRLKQALGRTKSHII